MLHRISLATECCDVDEDPIHTQTDELGDTEIEFDARVVVELEP